MVHVLSIQDAAGRAALKESFTVGNDNPTLFPSGQTTVASELLQRLQAGLEVASEMLSQPLRPASERLCGFVESVFPDEHGNIWINGWKKRSLDIGSS